MICERPGCDRPSRHAPSHGPETFTGWEHLCCAHTDAFMLAVGASCTDPDDAVTGWLSWTAEHARWCGPDAVLSPREAHDALIASRGAA